MEPRNRTSTPQNGSPAGHDPSSTRTAGLDQARLSDVRSALRQTQDVFGNDPAGGLSGPGTGDDLFGDPFALDSASGEPAPSVLKTGPAHARQTGPRRSRTAPAPQTSRLKWALAAAVLALAASMALFFLVRDESRTGGAQDPTRLVALGDSLMAAGDYDTARLRYTEALETQPDNPYVRQRLDQLERLRSAENLLAGNPEQDHRRLVAEGDSLYNLLDAVGRDEPLLTMQINAAAREAYLRALVYRPDDEEVRRKLMRLAQSDSILAIQAGTGAASAVEAERNRLRQQQLDQYRTAIEEGDQFMAAGNYLEAQIRFKEALIYQKDDTYAAQRLEMIDQLWQEANRHERFDAYVQRGDELTQARLFEQARTAYREALTILPGDTAVQARVAEVNRLEQEARQQLTRKRDQERQYQQALTDGDALVAAGQYDAAYEHFLKALQTYPDDPILRQRMQTAQDVINRRKQVDANGVYRYLGEDESPRLIGTLAELFARITYPASAVRDRLEGRVFVEFVVDEQGHVQDPRILRGLSPDCDREVLRVIRTARFEPAHVDGRPVKAMQTLPITFRLTGSEAGG